MDAAKNQPRNKDGRYDLGKLETPCKCGHALGEHTADRCAKTKDQPCLEWDCECTFFTKVRK